MSNYDRHISNAVAELRKARDLLTQEIGRLSGEPVVDKPVATAHVDGVVSAAVCGGDHTPGPWTVGSYDDPLPDTITVMADNGSGPRSICDIIGDRPVDLANARLIAAAPEMFQALKAVVMPSSNADANGNGVIPGPVRDRVEHALLRAVMGD